PQESEEIQGSAKRDQCNRRNRRRHGQCQAEQQQSTDEKSLLTLAERLPRRKLWGSLVKAVYAHRDTVHAPASARGASALMLVTVRRAMAARSLRRPVAESPIGWEGAPSSQSLILMATCCMEPGSAILDRRASGIDPEAWTTMCSYLVPDAVRTGQSQ